MFIIKIILWILLFALILSSNFFGNILDSMTTTVNWINSNFWAFLPTETRLFFSFIVLALVFGLVYAFKKT